ncbi:putative serine racemase [Cardiosporidium cionae]|uniref:Serine racemase n=1 Tax=Cardiosporidium cionae TaxID=476202 RepID=A0ABQ7JGL0_9APIC|nr:putative serine racemase [Cardiosporidium cionae]|eukprot:KAF8823020.1 putative serine racemase [Cardiosporidium cionae]
MVLDEQSAPSLRDIADAKNMLIGIAHETPLLTSEALQKVTHSSGNHGQAVALAAALLKLTAYIVMPSNSSPVKMNAVKEYGAEIILCEPTLESRESTANRIEREQNAYFLHPYNNFNVIAGQGTVALEIMSELSSHPLDAVVVPVGGGGLISGISIAIKSLRPEVHIIGAEPEMADDAFRSKKNNILVKNASTPKTIADGLRTNLGSLTWPIIRDKVTDVITVTEKEIASALRFVLERTKLVIEPSSAVGVAACFTKSFQEKKYKNVCVILCGGNLELDNLSYYLSLSEQP